jgi:hypothetical protein
LNVTFVTKLPLKIKYLCKNKIKIMNTVVAKSIFNSHSYIEYRKIIADLLLKGLTSGNEQSEAYVNYSNLNETRMNRLDKTIQVLDDNANKLKSLKGEYIWLVLSEGWCGDSAQVLPIINKMAEVSKNIELKIVFRDENEELMSHFLTNNNRSIPKLIIIDKVTGSILNSWGPRPIGAAQFMKDYKAEHGLIDEKAKSDLQMWYLHDKGISTQNEIIALMTEIEQ